MPVEYQYHEYADNFPMLPPEEVKALAEDIKANGLNHPVTLFESKILDGRNRYEACRSAGVEPRFEWFDGDSEQALAFVKSQNLRRRHLTSSQGAACSMKHDSCVAELAQMRMKAGKADPPQLIGEGRHDRESSSRTAKAFGTNRQYVADAKKIAEVSPETIEEVKRGELTITQAKRKLGLDAKKPTGQCRVDGVLVDDPPDIAKRRKKGLIPEGVIPEITTADPDAETVGDVKEDREERAAIKDEIGDEDWVAKMPLSTQLKGKPLSTFVADAVFFRHIAKARTAFVKTMAELHNKAGRIGAYGHKLRGAMNVKPPDEWKRCPEPKHDGCAGIGTTPMGDCSKCRGRGYLIF